MSQDKENCYQFSEDTVILRATGHAFLRIRF